MEEERKEQQLNEPATKHRGWKAMPYIIGNETFEKLGTLGTSANLLVYLTTVFHMRSVGAATLVNVFNGTTNLAPVFGAFLSDTYFGRYWTLGCASVSSVLGMLILTLTAGIPNLHPPKCDQLRGQACAGHTPWQLVVLLAAFAFLVVGAGGIRPCNLAFGADQFDPRTESGKKGISSFFNWYYFTFTFAMMVSSTVIIYVQSDVSWTLGYAIPTLLMVVSCAFFFVGTRIYVVVRPEGSPFTGIAQVLVAAFKKRRSKLPDNPKQALFDPPHTSALNSKLPYTQQFRFLDKASIIELADDIKPDGSAENPWRLCSLQQVEEVKCLARIIPIWSAGLLFNVAMVQVGNYVVFQALQSDRRLGTTGFQIPAGSFSIFGMIALTFWIPLYDRAVVPWLRKHTRNDGGFTLLQRMGIGIVLSVVALVVSAVVEARRRSYASSRQTLGTATGGGAVSSLSSLWLVPQLVVFGIAEAFNTIGQIEFYYKQFPENMRSIAGSLFFCSLAVSNYLSGFMVSVVHRTTGGGGGGEGNWLAEDLNEGRLDYFYLLIAAMGVLNFIYFIVCATWYRYKSLDASPPELALVANNSQRVKSPV
ncbi:protein NRT1/ PTR FAMILY 2.11-like [Iris pallida]|uniref:Protein NRT1/ PTR FAMILY 2.11-like n=1 Tax=Iris pallida TaxID=29817 RepID=A0AAX6HUE1_IRIPA|nr:protein NRT1/ PTR FAMILY 2.11-like [Iris pallida]